MATTDWRQNPNLVECFNNCVATFRTMQEPRPYDPELDALLSYEAAMREIGNRVKAGEPVPRFLLSRNAK